MTAKKMVLVLAMALIPCLAFGGQVTYSTSGTVTGPGVNVIKFTGVTNTVSISHGPRTTEIFGTLNFTCALTCINEITSTTVTVVLTQIAPPSVPRPRATFTATFMGGSINGTQPILIVRWTGINSFVTEGPSKIFTYYGPVIGQYCATDSCTLKTTFYVAQHIPEPGADLLLGLGTLALMGLATASRKLIST